MKENFNAIYSAIQWLQKYERNYFLHEGIFANWADVIVKTGTVLYTNVLYAEALKNFSEICALSNKSDLSEAYKQKYILLKEKINGDFWNGDYYIDWINEGKKYNYFSTDGNILAMLYLSIF